MQPAKPAITPNTWPEGITLRYTIAEVSKAKIGVRVFSMAVSALSILVSAMQKRKAGKKLPNSPDKITYPQLDTGILRKALIEKGISTTPADKILNAATWKAFNTGWPTLSYIPSFIKINELPQIVQISKKISHFFTVCDNWYVLISCYRLQKKENHRYRIDSIYLSYSTNVANFDAYYFFNLLKKAYGIH